VKTESFQELKRQKERRRMAALRKVRRNPASAAALQKESSLVGDVEWRITNLTQVARAIAKWK
jgi:hypothetical protein